MRCCDYQLVLNATRLGAAPRRSLPFEATHRSALITLAEVNEGEHDAAAS
jgi:hypothetical protein